MIFYGWVRGGFEVCGCCLKELIKIVSFENENVVWIMLDGIGIIKDVR